MEPLIIGVDPGNTSAIAAVNFDGELVLLESGRDYPPREMIREIVGVGKPVVVASDKGKTPSTVKKLASSLGAEIYEPENDLSSERKTELGEGNNSHEKDAVASALNAYNNLQREIRKIDELTEQLGKKKETVASKYFSDTPLKTKREDENTVENKGIDKKTEKSTKNNDESSRLRRKVRNLEKRINELEENNLELSERNSELQSQVDKLRSGKRDEIIKEREIAKREGMLREKDREIDELENELEKTLLRESQYRKALKKIREGAELVPIVDEIQDDIPENILTRSNQVKQELESQGIRAFLVDEVEGVELKEYMAVAEFPDPRDFQSVVDEYRESR